MKTGINIGTFTWEMSMEGCIREAARIGYQGIELMLNGEGNLSLTASEEELLSYRNIAKDAGISIPSLASGLYWHYSFTADDPLVREKAMQIAKKQIDAAKVLGADTVLILPGAVHVPFLQGSPVIPYDIAYDRALHAMKELAPYAEANRITVAMETVWNGFLLSPLEMRSFVDEIASDYVKVYLDVGNVWHYGYPQQWIRILGKRIARIHVKGFKRSVGTLAGFCELKDGDVPYPDILQALREIGYDSYLTGEIESAPGAVQRTYDALQKILSC